MRISFIALIIVVLGTLTACDRQETIPILEMTATVPGSVAPTGTPQPSATPTATPLPPRVLTVCLGQEPTSLFLYGDTTSAAQSVRQAIYDGPFDLYNFEVKPIILEKLPSLADGDASLRPVQVSPGTVIVDDSGNWATLAEGVIYRPSGCSNSDCAVSYIGEDPVMLDELVVQFRLLPGIEWSDGIALTAQDSVYSYQVLKDLYAGVPSDFIRNTRSYQALDELTVEWVGIPGYQSVYQTHFITPLPQHLWGGTAPEELLVAEISTQMPLGWGAYMIDEWVPGDHISLRRNPNYFRAVEGLPYFDFLVFRFSETPQAALDALLVGECDFVDRSAMLDMQFSDVMALQADQRLEAVVQSGTAWEQITFGIQPYDPARPAFFAVPEVRQAVAMCIDRQAIAHRFFADEALVPDTYVPTTHPLRNPDLALLQPDLQRAEQLLQLAGWVDQDADPNTPRISAGVAGMPDGTPFEVVYLTLSDAERPEVAQQIVDALAQCGIKVNVELQDWQTLLGPGPDSLVFGRKFDFAQFAWSYALQPSCDLFASNEIPGDYPTYPKGWGGSNASGYQNLEYDRICTQTSTSLPDSDAHLMAQYQLQSVFVEALPVIPLYQRLKLVAMRPDMCNVFVDPAFGSALSSIEAFDYGDNCE